MDEPIIREIPTNWREIHRINRLTNFLPDIERLNKEAVPICENNGSILLPIHEFSEEITELRDWMSNNISKSVKIFNRFSYIQHKFRVDTTFLGTNFRFSDLNDAVFFKIRWWS